MGCDYFGGDIGERKGLEKKSKGGCLKGIYGEDGRQKGKTRKGEQWEIC